MIFLGDGVTSCICALRHAGFDCRCIPGEFHKFLCEDGELRVLHAVLLGRSVAL